MGTRVYIQIVPESSESATPACVLFINARQADPLALVAGLLHEGTYPSELAKTLLNFEQDGEKFRLNNDFGDYEDIYTVVFGDAVHRNGMSYTLYDKKQNIISLSNDEVPLPEKLKDTLASLEYATEESPHCLDEFSNRQQDFALNDDIDSDIGSIKGRIDNSNNLAIALHFDGYSDCNSNDNNGAPLYIEKYNGALRVLVYSDINEEGPTHIISLEGARNENRLNPNEQPATKKEFKPWPDLRR